MARSHLLPVALAVPLGALFIAHTPWTQTGGIPAPDGGLIPNLQSIVGYGTAFAFGWFLYRQTGLFDIWRRTWPVYLIVAIVLTFYCARVMGDASNDPGYLASTGNGRFAVLAAYPLATWSWCIALLGAASRHLSHERRSIRYLSDSSYWIYIVHMPIVGAAQVLVAPWPVGWLLKYPLVLAVSVPVLLASYHWLVRSTWIGAWLNGRRYPR